MTSISLLFYYWMYALDYQWTLCLLRMHNSISRSEGPQALESECCCSEMDNVQKDN